jgi:hypothetical protein
MVQKPVTPKSREFFFAWQVSHAPPSRSAVVNFNEAILPTFAGCEQRKQFASRLAFPEGNPENWQPVLGGPSRMPGN